MAERESQTAPAADVIQVVAAASQAQAEKVRAILDRMDTISGLDPRKLQNMVDVMAAAKSDGGCGIGCW